MGMLLDIDRLRNAADAWESPHWRKARITTVGRDDLHVYDAFKSRADVDVWAQKGLHLIQGLLAGDAAVPALKKTEVAKKDAWDDGYDPAEKREIVVPCILRRVVSIHVAKILTDTLRGRLSRVGVAYIQGMIEPGPRAAKDVAREVRGGKFFYLKLDLRDAFNTVPWPALRRALRGFGLAEQFVGVVMALVRAPVEVQQRRRWIHQPRHRGALAGLHESGMLLNVLLDDIDRALEAIPGVVVRRYSDDVIIVGESRDAVTRAARKFCNAVWDIGMTVKEVNRYSDPRKLVQDIRKVPLVLLGIEIDHRGDLHMPQAVLDGLVRKLNYCMSVAAKTPTVVEGISKFHGTGSTGLLVADQEDLEEIIWGAYTYWSRLNEAEAEEFLDRASQLVGSLPTGSQPYRKLYLAHLGKVDTPHHLADGDAGIHMQPVGSISSREVFSLLERCLSWKSKEDGDGVDHYLSLYTDDFRLDAGDRCGWTGSGSHSWSSAMDSEGEDYSSSEDSSRYGIGFDRTASADLESAEVAVAGPEGPPAYPEWGPSGSSAKRTVVAFIRTQHLDDDTTRFVAARFQWDGVALRKLRTVSRVRGAETAPVTVDFIASLLPSGGRRLVVAGSAWLPKLLLSRERSIRAVGMYSVLSGLHEAAERRGTEVVAVGPVRGLRVQAGLPPLSHLPSSRTIFG